MCCWMPQRCCFMCHPCCLTSDKCCRFPTGARCPQVASLLHLCPTSVADVPPCACLQGICPISPAARAARAVAGPTSAALGDPPVLMHVPPVMLLHVISAAAGAVCPTTAMMCASSVHHSAAGVAVQLRLHNALAQLLLPILSLHPPDVSNPAMMVALTCTMSSNASGTKGICKWDTQDLIVGHRGSGTLLSV